MFKKTLILVFVSAICFPIAKATPLSTEFSTIRYVRPYLTGDIYITLHDTILCGTKTFRIEASAPGRDQMYSAALSAFMGNKKILVEALTSTGCAGYATKLQSIYLSSD